MRVLIPALTIQIAKIGHIERILIAIDTQWLRISILSEV